ncbi:hypothetical protein [Mycolicibacterium mageritense]|uniref:hypothetical protein n=1 Tax=Mycolicibacterium mageritense TaxID=53462 RepID=UPI001E3791CD|nr:hypothetical protein [Mycolicibacterium mageritense]GJJ24109.1 hypothetical protein MTY414_77830 [Mycolicibacterium mageritense]
MGSNPARRQRRAMRYGHRRPTRMTEYQRNRQAEQPPGEVKVHAHLHGLTINAAVELYEAGAFEGIPCAVTGCGQAIEWSSDLNGWQHHATKIARCSRGRGYATPPDWYVGEPVLDEAYDLAADDNLAEDNLTTESDISAKDFHADVTPEEPAPRRRPRVDGNPYDTEFARGVMAGLQDKAVYQGTVPADEVERRRLRNRDANRARRALRRSRVKRSRERHRGAA